MPSSPNDVLMIAGVLGSVPATSSLLHQPPGLEELLRPVKRDADSGMDDDPNPETPDPERGLKATDAWSGDVVHDVD
jgi:hypothetical protein